MKEECVKGWGAMRGGWGNVYSNSNYFHRRNDHDALIDPNE